MPPRRGRHARADPRHRARHSEVPRLRRPASLSGGHHLGKWEHHPAQEAGGGGSIVTRAFAAQPFWRRAFRWCFAVEPMRHAWWETLIMRGIIAWAVLFSLWHPSNMTSQPQPHGLAAWGAD